MNAWNKVNLQDLNIESVLVKVMLYVILAKFWNLYKRSS